MVVQAAGTQGPNKLLTITGRVNGEPCEFVLDCGANCSIISRKFAERIGLKSLSSNMQLQTADDKPAKPAQRTERLRVEVHGTVVLMPFLIHDLPNHVKGLLGLDWCRHTRCVLDVADQILTFKPREICLHNDKEITEDNDFEVYYTESQTDTEDDVIGAEQTWDDDRLTDSTLLEYDLSYLVDKDQQDIVRQMLIKARRGGYFASKFSELGGCNTYTHEIRTLDSPPIFQHPYRKSLHERKAMRDVNILKFNFHPTR